MVGWALALCWVAGWAQGSEPPPRVFPPRFSVRASMVSEQDHEIYAVDMSVDTHRNLIAMQAHFPKVDGQPSLGDVRVILNVTSLEFYSIYMGPEPHVCITSPMTGDSEILKSFADWNPWIWLYLIKYQEKRLPSPGEMAEFMEKHEYVVNYGSDETDLVRTIGYQTQFRLSDIDRNYGFRNDEIYTINFKWYHPRTDDGWRYNIDWGRWGNGSFPMEVEVEVGKAATPSVRKATHVVLSNAVPDAVEEELFSVPDHVWCRRRVPAAFPPWPVQYGFRAEVAIPPVFLGETDAKGFLFYTREYYDTRRGLSAAEFQKQDVVEGSGASTASVYAVNDHLTGLTFEMDLRAGRCFIAPLALSESRNLSDVWDLARLHLSDPQSFFDITHQYSLDGTRNVRGIATDKLVTQRYDWPRALIRANKDIIRNVSSVWEWFVSRPDWVADELSDQETSVPVRLDITLDMTFKTAFQPLHGSLSYNLFDFHRDERGLAQYFDMAPCFHAANITNVTLSVQFNDSAVCAGAWAKAVGDPLLKAKLENSVNDLLFHNGPLESRLRVTVASLEPTKPMAKVFLTEPFNYTGIEERNVSGVSAAAVRAAWVAALGGPDFVLPVPISQNILHDVPCAVKSFNNYSPPVVATVSAGYSSGALAGLGVGMLGLGLALGVLAVLLYARLSPSRPLGDHFIRFVNKADS